MNDYPINDTYLIIYYIHGSVSFSLCVTIAFEEGIKCGASGIELDVHKTKDNKIVVIHDEEVERTFKGKGLVKDFTLRELKELQTRRALFEGVQGTGIPTLEEVLNLIRNSDVILNIELTTCSTSF